MAANLQKRELVSLGKRFMNHISYSSALNSANSSSSLPGRRAVHKSVYDKNPEEYLSSVSDEVDEAQSADKYWTPHRQTGVFGPVTDHVIICGEHFSTTVDSVLEQKAFFRDDIEDLEKPIYPYVSQNI